MRFSAIFQQPLPRLAAAVPVIAPGLEQAPLAAPATPTAEAALPEALDERVRLLGEWQQLGEA